MSVVENIKKIKNSLPENVTLVAVSKTKPIEAIISAYDTGQRIFGENKVQELQKKYELLPKDIEWHMIGHLQSNKVKYIAPFISLIHGVDNYKLLEVIDKEGAKNNRIIPCLLQVHIAKEQSKFGSNADEIIHLMDSEKLWQLKNIEIRGLMGMATYTSDVDVVRNEFKTLKNIFDLLKSKYYYHNSEFCIISMGMSDDYPIAIDSGSTMVRIGSSIFGEREYLH